MPKTTPSISLSNLVGRHVTVLFPHGHVAGILMLHNSPTNYKVSRTGVFVSFTQKQVRKILPLGESHSITL